MFEVAIKKEPAPQEQLALFEAQKESATKIGRAIHQNLLVLDPDYAQKELIWANYDLAMTQGTLQTTYGLSLKRWEIKQETNYFGQQQQQTFVHGQLKLTLLSTEEFGQLSFEGCGFTRASKATLTPHILGPTWTQQLCSGEWNEPPSDIWIQQEYNPAITPSFTGITITDEQYSGNLPIIPNLTYSGPNLTCNQDPYAQMAQIIADPTATWTFIKVPYQWSWK